MTEFLLASGDVFHSSGIHDFDLLVPRIETMAKAGVTGQLPFDSLKAGGSAMGLLSTAPITKN